MASTAASTPCRNSISGWPTRSTGPAGFFTIDSGAVGGFRCDPGACANGAATYGGGTPRSKYSITIEQAAGTSLIWSFNAINGGVQEEGLKAPNQTRSFVARPKRPGSAPVVLGPRQVVTMAKD
jgi:hypothetical protein